MPRTVPASISALVGQQIAHAPIFLMKWELSSGTQFYSSREQISYGGGTYEANRIHSVPSFEPGLIDRKTRDFSSLDIELSNLPNSGSSLPISALVGATSQSVEDAKITIYAYSVDASDAVLVWWGFSQRVKFSGDGKIATLGATFFWDALDLKLPYVLAHQEGFGATESAARTNDSLKDDQDETTVPIVFGVAQNFYRPVIYDSRVDGSTFHVNFIVSGCNGQPFQATDLAAADVRLFGVTNATAIEFLTGSSTQTAPANLTRFPDGAAHPNIAYCYAAFQITDEIKDRLDEIKSDDIKIMLQSGRPLLDTTLPSENAVLIIKDLMRDPNFGLGIGNALFDAAAVSDAANYVGTRYQVRCELTKDKSASERIQMLLADCHCFITFDNGLIQIRAKKNGQTAGVSFYTIDSAGSGRRIYRDTVDVYEKDSSELVNQVTWKYQKKSRHRRIVTLYDGSAQSRAGGLAKKVVEDIVDETEEGGLFDEEQVKTASAIIVREEQNADLFVEFSVPFWDGCDVSPGDLIAVYAPEMYGANNTLRVIKQSIDTTDLCLITMTCQVYKTAVYDDNSASLGVDLLHGGTSSDSQGRPPDVTPVSLTIVDIVASDTEGKEATLRAVWTYPTVDLAAEQTQGMFREYPISELELWWRYTDEKFTQSRLGATVVYPTPTADFIVPFYKSRSVECFFVALGHNRSRARLGYIPDSTKITYLTANLSSTGAAASVAAVAGFSANDYIVIEKEIALLTGAAPSGSTLNFVASAGNRTAQFDTVAIAHPSGTQVAVAKKSYPSLIKALDRRFTYPIVAGLIAIATGDGVRFKWQDPNADNLETFILYWSIDADALSNAAKLGVANPAWYFTDPYTPPAGVNIAFSDDRRFKLTQAEIGAANVIVYARVAATIKRNFSSQLSNSAQAASTGLNAPPLYNPSSPNASDLYTNIVNVDTEIADAYVEVRIWADDLNHAHTFADAVALNAVAVFKPTADVLAGDPDVEPVKFGGAIANTAQTNVIVGGVLPLGQAWSWMRNVLNNGGGKTISTGGRYDFVSGGLLTVLPTDPKTVNAPGFGAITREDGGNKIDLVPVFLMQDGVDVVYFKHLYFDVSINAGAFNRDRRIALKPIEHLYVKTALDVVGGINNVIATITVLSTAGFNVPTAAEPIKYISIESELIGYTGVTATTFTGCTRGVDFTTAASHANGVRVSGAYREVYRVKRKAQATAQYRAQVAAVGGKLSNPATSGSQSATPGDGATAPGALAAPTLSNLIANTVDGDPEKNLARCTLQLFTANSLDFLANNIRQFGFAIFEKTFDDSAAVGQPQTFLRMSNDYTGGNNLALDFYLKMGRRFEIPEVYTVNGDKQTATPCSVKFFAGGLKYVDPTDSTFTVPAPTFQVAPTAEPNSNKLVNFTIRVAQNGTDIVWFKQLIVEVTFDGGTNWRSIEGSPLGLKSLDDLHASATPGTPAGKGFHDFSFTCKRKAGAAFNVRCQTVAVGGKPSAVTTFGSPLGSSAGDVGDDTAAPSGLVGVAFRRLKKNGLKLDLTAPSTNALKLRNALIYIANNVRASATLWVNAADLTTSTSSEAAAAIQTAPTGGVVIPVDRQMLEGIFGVGATVWVYGRWSNDFGPSATFSTESSFSLSQASGQSEVGSTSDQVAPGTPPAPSIKEQYGSIVVKAKPPSTGSNQITKWQVAISDVNSAPTTADPPTATGGATVFAYEEAADGVQKFRFQYAPAQTRYFFSRCQNASFPGTWSNWSSSTNISGGVITRPLQDEIGASAPSFSGVPAGNMQAYTNIACTISAGFFAPINTWDDGIDIIFEFYLPTDSTALSLVVLQWERYRAATGALKDSGSLNPSATSVLKLPLRSFQSSFRFRIRNKYRVGGVSGWSFWMGTSSNVYITPGGTTGAPLTNYDPGLNVFAESDYYVEAAYPTKYASP